MGKITAPSHCFFTNLETKNYPTTQDCIDYSININGNSIMFCLSSSYDWRCSDFILSRLHIIRGLILNSKWPKNEPILNEEKITEILIQSNYPESPKEKLDNLFLEIYKLQKIDGQILEQSSGIFQPEFWYKLYIRDRNEFDFYLRALQDLSLVKLQVDPHHNLIVSLSTTFKGLNYQIELTEQGEKSLNCFIAMSFDPKNMEIRQSIKKAVQETGYIPIIIDEVHIDSEKTINDEIIANIKKSKFCISDFTDQKDGVYFEAGYALGRGLKVIYTCKKQSFSHTHFDTNHFPHIIYDTPAELYEGLKMKIEAWVK